MPDLPVVAVITAESWRGQSDLDEHMKSAHIAAAGDALAEAPAIHPMTPIDVT